MKKILVILVALIGFGVSANAQSWRTNDAKQGTYTSNDGWNATFGKTGNSNNANGAVYHEFAIVIRNAANDIVAEGYGYFSTSASIMSSDRNINFRKQGGQSFSCIFSSETKFKYGNRVFSFTGR